MKLRYFNYMPADYKAMEEKLNCLAQKGLALQWLRFGFAGFAPTARADLRYTVEPVPQGQTRDEWDDWEYRLLCADTGWEVAAADRTFRVFASKEGSQPIPLDTDPALAFREKWARPLLRDGLCYILFGLVDLFFYIPNGFIPGQWYSTFYLAAMLFACGWFLFCGARELWLPRPFRPAAADGELLPPIPTPFALLRRSIRDFVVISLILLLVFVLLF